ncbi:hypothetical protein [Mycolicibacterium arenosum]|uniref:Uncharacterized protein n=1 Tax=Mycolicibacterium arenosum TaxID=2952157 RepID=A0ABT1LYQ3_9MYCO|nr:hypothetical protein [Mycolicibacterium sp. CAU 1645]MCP9271169.1 hypothetical protein [Mycolicibacterium sp. CAU 1645]
MYKRIGSRANLVAELIEMHTGRIQFEFHPCGTWEDMIWDWCQQLHRSLASRPHLTLMAQGRVPAVMRSSVQALIAAVVRDGVPVEVAGECCWSLADLTINDAVELAREMTGGESVTTNGSVQLSKRTSDAIKWVLRGVGAAIESPDR